MQLWKGMREGKRRNEENLYTLIISGLQHMFSENKQIRRRCLLYALFLQKKRKCVYVKKRKKKRNWKDKPKSRRGRKQQKKMSGSQCNIIIKRCPPAVIHNRTCAIQFIFVKFVYVYTERPESVFSSESEVVTVLLSQEGLPWVRTHSKHEVSTAAIFIYMRKDRNDTA